MSLIIEHLTTNYGDKTVLKDISLVCPSSAVTVLMGTSGSGKTTLLRSILGIHNPKEGNILLNNKNIINLPIESRNIGYLPQDYALFPHLTVEENVEYGLKIRGVNKVVRAQKTKEMLSLVDLSHLEKRKIKQLSGGQKQRVGLARALAINPELLLLDEPLSNIDQVTKFEVAKQLKSLFQTIKIPVIFVTHSYEDAIFLADKLVILIDGEIAQEGTWQEITKNPANEYINKILKPFPISSSDIQSN